MESQNGTPKGPATSTDPGSQLWINHDSVTGLRIWGTNVEHNFPVTRFKRIWVGRDPAGPDVHPTDIIRIDHHSVSKRHAKIEWTGPHLLVVDNESKNGTRSPAESQAQGVFELVCGAVVSFGDVKTVAFNARTQRIRAGFRRFLGYGDGAQLDIERLQHGATHRQHVAFVGTTGSGGAALARYLHDSLPANAWPFVVPKKLPRADDAAAQRELVRSAAYGTLLLDTGRRGVRFDKLPHVFKAIASNAYHVRLAILAEPGTSLENLVGDEVRSQLTVIALPALTSRRDEMQMLLADTVTHHCTLQGAAGTVLDATEWAELATRLTDSKRCRHPITTWDGLEENACRLVAIRKNGSVNGAETHLGMSHGSLSKWARKAGWPLARPGRPAGR